MKIDTVIDLETDKLKAKASKNGIYENFGQREVRKLEDKFIDSSNYTLEMNYTRNRIQEFENWCMNYEG